MRLTSVYWQRFQSLTTRRSRRSIVVVMLLLGALVSALGARTITLTHRARQQTMLDGNAAIVRSRVDRITMAAVDTLQSVRPLWQLRSDPSDAEFKQYVRAGVAQRNDGGTDYDGLTDIVFVRDVPAGRARDFARSVRAERPARYAIGITGDRPHYIVDFHTSDTALGTDLYPLVQRRMTLDAARDRGRPTASTWYVHVADRGLPADQRRWLTLVAVPVYQGARTPATIVGRRRALRGWLVTPLFADDIVDDVAADLPVDVQLFATRSGQPIAAVATDDATDLDDLRVEVLGRTWDLRIGPTATTVGRGLLGATGVLVAGVCLTLLLTALFWMASMLSARSESRASTATARLRERDDYLRVIAERVPVGIAELDAESRILWANNQLAEVTGVAVDQIIGLPWSHLVHPDDRAAVHAAHTVAIAGGGAFHVRHRLHGGDGVRWIEKAGAPTLEDDGSVIRVVAVVSDVSAVVEFEDRLRAARDRAVEASRVKSEFLANMSDEIHTPLNGVISMADVLYHTELTTAQRSKITTLRAAATQLRDLLSDILDLSRIEAGRLELDDVAFDPSGTITSLVRLQAPDAFAKSLRVQVDLDDDLPTCVRGDQLRLRQVLDNLLGNAIRCTDQGEIRLSAVVVRQRGDRAWIRFDVRDTGLGISTAMIESVFDPFTQTDASDTRAYGGSGLGLAISRQLVEMMGGRLEVKSTTGRGSHFGFTIALTVASPPSTTADPVPTSHGGAEVRGSAEAADAGTASTAVPAPARLLVVEDNPINREVARELLSTLGYRTEIADDGSAGVDACMAGHFDAILMDCQMPVMDGYEATARIRELDAATRRHTPIIAMTASAMAGDRQRCLAAGMDDYIAKPVSVDVLTEVLGRWIGNRPDAPQHDVGDGDAPATTSVCGPWPTR